MRPPKPSPSPERQDARIERQVAALLRSAGPDFDALAVFFGYPGHGSGFKARLSRLVGWDWASDPVLGTEAAYDVVYEKILAAGGMRREHCDA